MGQAEEKYFLATIITVISAVLWIASLFFIAITTYNPEHNLTGLDILLSGWLGPLSLNFAWYANITYAFSLFLLLANKPPIKPPIKLSIISAVLAFNAITFHKLPLNEGGGAAAIYGYGIGFVLWVLAILFILFATSIKGNKFKNSSDKLVVFLSLLSIMAFSGFITFKVYESNFYSGNYEKTRLEYSLFKRGEICKVDIAEPAIIIPMDTPIEIIDKGIYPALLFDKPKYLLESGVFAIRKDGIEYRLASESGKTFIKELPYSSKSSATLIVQSGPTKPPKGHGGKVIIKSGGIDWRDYKATLLAPDGKTKVFEQIWRREFDYNYCPEYKTFGKETDQPRKLILDSLGISQ
jgi:uncharacterized membrane protein